MGHFQIPIKAPEEIIPRLGKQELHWKKGRSAFELSTSWMNANGIPPLVADVLAQAPEWNGATFMEGIFERETELPGRGRPSQTDLLAILRLCGGNAILGVEGKVDESFGPVVGEWLGDAGDQNKTARLAGLCATLGMNPQNVGGLYYQLFHRTCAAIYEAKRFGYDRALMLVHSFAETDTNPDAPACFADFQAFSRAAGMPVTAPGSISPAKMCDGVEVRLAWVSQKPSA